MNRSVNRSIPPSLLRPTGRAHASTSAMIKASTTFTTSCTFVEDFNMEHSDTALNASRATVDAAALRSTSQLFSSPSCVYLG